MNSELGQQVREDKKKCCRQREPHTQRPRVKRGSGEFQEKTTCSALVSVEGEYGKKGGRGVK